MRGVIRVLIVLGFAIGAGCAATPPAPPPLSAPSKEEKTLVMKALLACTSQKIVLLDDALSDAQTIATGLVSACVLEFQALGMLGGRNLAPNARAIFLEKAKSFYQDIALREVLGYRNWQRKQQ